MYGPNESPPAQEDGLGAFAPTSPYGRSATALAPSVRSGAQWQDEENAPGDPAAFLRRPRGGQAARSRPGRLRAPGGDRSSAGGCAHRRQGVRAVGGPVRGAAIFRVWPAGALRRDRGAEPSAAPGHAALRARLRLRLGRVFLQRLPLVRGRPAPLRRGPQERADDGAARPVLGVGSGCARLPLRRKFLRRIGARPAVIQVFGHAVDNLWELRWIRGGQHHVRDAAGRIPVNRWSGSGAGRGRWRATQAELRRAGDAPARRSVRHAIAGRPRGGRVRPLSPSLDALAGGVAVLGSAPWTARSQPRASAGTSDRRSG